MFSALSRLFIFQENFCSMFIVVTTLILLLYKLFFRRSYSCLHKRLYVCIRNVRDACPAVTDDRTDVVSVSLCSLQSTMVRSIGTSRFHRITGQSCSYTITWFSQILEIQFVAISQVSIREEASWVRSSSGCRG